GPRGFGVPRTPKSPLGPPKSPLGPPNPPWDPQILSGTPKSPLGPPNPLWDPPNPPLGPPNPPWDPQILFFSPNPRFFPQIPIFFPKILFFPPQTMGAALGVSLAPHLVLLLVPADSGSPRRRGLLRLLLSFAAGGLLGDAFLHLIPHALAAALWVGLWVLAGIVAFLTVELLVRHGGAHGHGHGQFGAKNRDFGQKRGKTGIWGEKRAKKWGKTGILGGKTGKKMGFWCGTADKFCVFFPFLGAAMAASGYLNLAADAAHNFTDGLALGAAFWASPARGALTALAVLLHELPHELGDMALLLRAGCSKGQAMLLQLLTALAALAGAACSLLAEGSGAGAISGILPFTAGGFIYLGTVSVLPEILHDSGAGQALLQLLALLAGVAMMLLIAYYE
uniref:Zinc transporter SLC39A7 n=1 Tax=Taeniopygia guttata TaxID=59729 RepID=A0A674GF32_TAEGU